MNICIVHGGTITSPSGGTDRVTAFCSGLADWHDVSLVVPEFDSSLPSRLDDVDVVETPTSESRIIEAFRLTKIAHQEANKRNALLQFEHSILGGIGSMVGRRTYVLDMHDLAFSRFDHIDSIAAPGLKSVVSLIEQLALKRADHVVVVSNTMRQIIHDRWNVPLADVSVIPNGYFPELVDSFTGVEEVPGRVSFLGTLHPKIDVQAIVNVARLSVVDEVVIIGDGYERERLERLVDQCDLRALNVVGQLPDRKAFEIVASSQVVINPQQQSKLQRASCPVKFNYYAALGTPMVVSAGPDAARSLTEQNAAVLIDSNQDFATAVHQVLEDDRLRSRMKMNARAAADDLTWSSRSKQLMQLYESLGGR